MFYKGSRYANVAEDRITGPRGREIVYKRLRFIPETPAQLRHPVAQGERLDHVAFRYFRDPERYWRICDANRAMWPEDLVAAPGEKILIPPGEE